MLADIWSKRKLRINKQFTGIYEHLLDLLTVFNHDFKALICVFATLFLLGSARSCEFFLEKKIHSVAFIAAVVNTTECWLAIATSSA